MKVSELGFEELKKALIDRPKIDERTRLGQMNQMAWVKDFERKFEAFQEGEAKKKAQLKQQIQNIFDTYITKNESWDEKAIALELSTLRRDVLVLLDQEGTDDFVCIEKKQLQDRIKLHGDVRESKGMNRDCPCPRCVIYKELLGIKEEGDV